MWSVYIGPQNMVYMLTRADNVATWEQRRAAAQTHALEQRAAIAEPVSVQLLYSVTRRRPEPDCADHLFSHAAGDLLPTRHCGRVSNASFVAVFLIVCRRQERSPLSYSQSTRPLNIADTA